MHDRRTRKVSVELIPAAMAAAWLGTWIPYYTRTHYFTLATIIQDDAYYYLLPAWNCARLGWFTFDAVTPTSGFQPLWELLLVLVARVTTTREIFLRAALVIGALLYAATALVVARVARAAWRSVHTDGGNIAASVAAAMMLLNLPISVANSAAKENALYGFVLSVLLFLRMRPRPAPGGHRAALSGALAGLVLLARLLPASIAVVLLPRLPEDRSARRRFVTNYVLAALLTLLPWSLYAYWTFGSVVPMSGRMKLLGFWPDLLAGRAGLAGSASAVVDYVVASVRFALGLSSRFWPDVLGTQGLHRLPFVILTAIGLLWSFRTRRTYLLVLTTGVLLAVASMPVLLHLRLDEIYYWRWYVVELPILLPVFAGAGAEALVTRVRDTRIRAAVLVALGCALVPSIVDVAAVAKPAPDYVDRGEWNQTVLRLALETKRDWPLPEGEHIGAFSAGLLGWFVERPVINLDGLANDEILPYWKAHAFQEYCVRRNITLYIDAAPPQDSFRDFSIVRTVPISGDTAYPTYYFARLQASKPR